MCLFITKEFALNSNLTLAYYLCLLFRLAYLGMASANLKSITIVSFIASVDWMDQGLQTDFPLIG